MLGIDAPPPVPDGNRAPLDRRHDAARVVAGRDRARDASITAGHVNTERAPLATLGYEERPHRFLPRGPLGSAPEVITIDRAPIGRGTLVAIEEELAAEARELAKRPPACAEAGGCSRGPNPGDHRSLGPQKPPAAPSKDLTLQKPPAAAPKDHALQKPPAVASKDHALQKPPAAAPKDHALQKPPAVAKPAVSAKDLAAIRPATPGRNAPNRPVAAAALDAPVNSDATMVPPPRPAMATLGYEERPVASSSARSAHGSAPELIAIGEARVGLETHSAIEQELLAESVIAPPSHPELEPTVVESCPAGAQAVRARGTAVPMPIYELRSFVLDEDPAAMGTDEAARREFVEARILFRLPALSMKEVVKVEVTSGPVPGTSLLTVWCRVPDRLR